MMLPLACADVLLPSLCCFLCLEHLFPYLGASCLCFQTQMEGLLLAGRLFGAYQGRMLDLGQGPCSGQLPIWLSFESTTTVQFGNIPKRLPKGLAHEKC